MNAVSKICSRHMERRSIMTVQVQQGNGAGTGSSLVALNKIHLVCTGSYELVHEVPPFLARALDASYRSGTCCHAWASYLPDQDFRTITQWHQNAILVMAVSGYGIGLLVGLTAMVLHLSGRKCRRICHLNVLAYLYICFYL